jgi:hypothetical protein
VKIIEVASTLQSLGVFNESPTSYLRPAADILPRAGRGNYQHWAKTKMSEFVHLAAEAVRTTFQWTEMKKCRSPTAGRKALSVSTEIISCKGFTAIVRELFRIALQRIRPSQCCRIPEFNR